MLGLCEFSNLHTQYVARLRRAKTNLSINKKFIGNFLHLPTKQSNNMSRYKVYDQNGLNYLTLTTVGWIDVFTRQRYRDILIESLKYCQEHKGLMICAYVIMSNHIHLIARTEGYALSDVLRDFKKFTAHEIIKAIETEPESRKEWLMYLFKYFAKYESPNRVHQFWQQSNHPIELYSQEVTWQKIAYIHLNPVRAGIVDYASDYVYSSARDYQGKKGLLDVVLVEPIGPVKPFYLVD
jgi:putative transposase